jgi:hypothetical protein
LGCCGSLTSRWIVVKLSQSIIAMADSELSVWRLSMCQISLDMRQDDIFKPPWHWLPIIVCSSWDLEPRMPRTQQLIVSPKAAMEHVRSSVRS